MPTIISTSFFQRTALQPGPSQTVPTHDGFLLTMQNSTVLFTEPHEVPGAQSSILAQSFSLEALLATVFTISAILSSLVNEKVVRLHSVSSHFSVEVIYDCGAWCISALKTSKACCYDFLTYYKITRGVILLNAEVPSGCITNTI